MRGVDISIHNHDRYKAQGSIIPWDKLKAAGVDFVMLRTGYGQSYIEPHFQQDVHDAHSVGMQVGAYHYSYALTASEAMQEAIFCKQILENTGVFLELPVFLDMEDDDGYKKRHGFTFNRRNITSICKAWLEQIKPLNSGLYASYSWFEDWIDWRKLHEEYQCPIWNAQITPPDDLQGYMWQFTFTLKIDGHEWDGDILYDNVHRAGLDPWSQFIQS